MARSKKATRAPCSTKAWTSASPIPAPPPVTSTTLFCREGNFMAQWDSLGTAAPDFPTRKSRSQPRSACWTWST